MVCDEDQSILFTVTDTTTLGFKFDDYISSDSKFRYIQALQGRVHDYTINGVSQITVENLDKNNRLYFTEPNVAQNGIFIDLNDDFSTSTKWKKVDNIYQVTDPYSYQFGVDPVSGSCYIEFPDSIANTISNGLYIKYITTDGMNGNVKARIINRYFDDDTKAYLMNGDTITINNNISVSNSKAAVNGADPATIDEMYQNYQRVKNTFDTLVTLLDYENFIYMYEKPDGTNVVSNIRVSDRTNDLTDSYKVWTLNKSQEILRTKVLDDSSSGEPKLDYNTVKFYPLNPIPAGGIQNKSIFDTTFSNNTFIDNGEANKDTFGENDVQGNDSTSLINIVNDQKVMTTKIDEMPHDLIIVPYDIKGEIYLNHKVSQYVANEVKNNVDNALYQALNARKLTIGEAPTYTDILNIIKEADNRIDYVALSPLTFLPAEQVDSTWVRKKAIWNGNTPWAHFKTDFTYKASQSNGKDKSFSADDSGEYVEIDSSIFLEDSSSASKYKVGLNENLVAFAPQYKTTTQYSNYLYYKYVGIAELKANTPYQLPEGARIEFYESLDDANAESVSPKYRINSGEYVQSTFAIKPNDSGWLTATRSIDVIDYIEGRLSDNQDSIIEWISNSVGLIDSLKQVTWGSDKPTDQAYTLKAGEYFIFKVKGEDAFTLLGEGNTLGVNPGLSNIEILDLKNKSQSWFTLNWDKIIEGTDQSSISWMETKGYIFHYLQNQIYVFGEGYTFGYTFVSDSSSNDFQPRFGGWRGDGTIFKISPVGDDNSCEFNYAAEDNTYTKLPKLLGDDKWQGFLRLSYNLSAAKPFTLLYQSDSSQYVKHAQHITISQKIEDSSIAVVTTYPEDDSSGNYPLYLQSNIAIESPGAIPLMLSNSFFESAGPLKVYSYNKNENIQDGVIFEEMDSSVQSVWHTPGDSSDVIVFGAYSNVDSSLGGLNIDDSKDVQYFIARGDSSLTFTGNI